MPSEKNHIKGDLRIQTIYIYIYNVKGEQARKNDNGSKICNISLVIQALSFIV